MPQKSAGTGKPNENNNHFPSFFTNTVIMSASRPWQKMTVRAKILIVFLSLSMVALGVVGYAAFSTMSDMGAYALTSSGQAG